MLLACSVAAAVGRAITVPATLALLSEVVPFGSLGRAMGAFGVGEALGFLFGPSTGGVVWDSYGPQVSFYAMGAAMGIGSLLTVGFIHEKQWLAERRKAVLPASTPVEIGKER
jgi:MFS family permease